MHKWTLDGTMLMGNRMVGATRKKTGNKSIKMHAESIMFVNNVSLLTDFNFTQADIKKKLHKQMKVGMKVCRFIQFIEQWAL